MTDHRREDDRLGPDGAPMSPAHRRLDDKIDGVADGLALHVEDHSRVERRIDFLADELLGPLAPGYDDEQSRDESKGVNARLDGIEETLGNGVTTRLSGRDRTAIWVAAIGVVGGVGVAVVAGAVALLT